MWSDLNVAEATLDCAPPYSFYFDLVGGVWKTAASNNLPLHRLCTLARKQGARWVVIESALARSEVRAEIDALDEVSGGGGAAEAVAISFFAGDVSPEVIADVADTAFLGQAVVVNYRPPNSGDFSHSYVFEALFPPPSLKRGGEAGERLLLNNYLAAEQEFDCVARGRQFKIRGVYYCQQNGNTHVCAHASLRMAIGGNGSALTAGYINKLLGVQPPCSGLQLGQIFTVLKDQGFDAGVVDCSSLQTEQYLCELASVIESGDQALLVFTTDNQPGGQAVEHVVLVYGHTRHSDEWHPQAIPVYAGPGSAKYLPASNWIDHFLIHDDNLGPYYTLSSQALEFHDKVKAHWIVAIRKGAAPIVSARGAESAATIVLSNLLPVLSSLTLGKWFEYITRSVWRYVLRTILISRDDYIAHLLSTEGHDGSKMDPSEVAPLGALPERLWIVEFTLPALFTGNRSKLGEVILAADPSQPQPTIDDITLGARLPSLLLMKTAAHSLSHTPSSLHSHSPIYRCGAYGQEW